MSFYMTDVETDGPCPGLFSMVSIGCVIVRENLTETFFGKLKPISERWEPEALAISEITREEHLQYDDPELVMNEFCHWVESTSNGKPIFIADNNGFDWSFVNYYFHRYEGRNPFGFSSRNLNDIWKGMEKDMFSSFKHLRKTKHTHCPVQDSLGNAEALMTMKNMGLKISLK